MAEVLEKMASISPRPWQPCNPRPGGVRFPSPGLICFPSIQGATAGSRLQEWTYMRIHVCIQAHIPTCRSRRKLWEPSLECTTRLRFLQLSGSGGAPIGSLGSPGIGTPPGGPAHSLPRWSCMLHAPGWECQCAGLGSSGVQ